MSGCITIRASNRDNTILDCGWHWVGIGIFWKPWQESQNGLDIATQGRPDR